MKFSTENLAIFYSFVCFCLWFILDRGSTYLSDWSRQKDIYAAARLVD